MIQFISLIARITVYDTHARSRVVRPHQRILSRLTGALDEIVIERVSNLCQKRTGDEERGTPIERE